jgi:hypothetical protein
MLCLDELFGEKSIYLFQLILLIDNYSSQNIKAAFICSIFFFFFGIIFKIMNIKRI